MKSLFRFYKEDDTQESCGFILDKSRAIQLKNIHSEPTEGFEIDPAETLAYIDRLKGIWHTHPGELAVLSGEDKLYMEQWPELSHYVIGKDGVRKYVVQEGVVIDANFTPR